MKRAEARCKQLAQKGIILTGFLTLLSDMIKRSAYVIALIFFLCLVVPLCFAKWETGLGYLQTIRLDVHNDENLYIHRIFASLNYKKEGYPVFKVSPFFEARRNLVTSSWSRYESGFELGFDIYPWLYVGQGFQYAWLENQPDSPETELRLMLSNQIAELKKIKIIGYLLDEFTYDLEEGEGIRNEAVIGAMIPINKNFTVNIDWRHIDPIHESDSDTFEASLTLSL